MLSALPPTFEVVKEGRILHFGLGDRRLTLIPIVYNKESSIVDKRFEISNLALIRDMDKIVKLTEVLTITE